MSLVFIGPPAAGKSRAGKRIARRLGASFADTDKLFAQQHGAISEFIPREGEAEFRRLEREVVASALREFEVVSLGGGAILDANTQADLESDAHDVVLLVASPKAIEERISGKTNRPLLSGIDSWIETFNARKEIYERLADIKVDTSFRPMWQVVNEVRRYLKKVDSPLLASSNQHVDEEATQDQALNAQEREQENS
ncbi:MAG: shikimate kinase [Gulosibacter sp.]|uniref:shikimate kinase n=1 Tax=Gulosibacter sp. TaxID=2817531 RepID=UPI003F8E6A4B